MFSSSWVLKGILQPDEKVVKLRDLDHLVGSSAWKYNSTVLFGHPWVRWRRADLIEGRTIWVDDVSRKNLLGIEASDRVSSRSSFRWQGVPVWHWPRRAPGGRGAAEKRHESRRIIMRNSPNREVGECLIVRTGSQHIRRSRHRLEIMPFRFCCK
jgi:hypothetical protein